VILCGSLVNGAFTIAQDTWIAVLLMGILFLPEILIYSRICALFPGKNLYDIIYSIFGRTSRFILTLLMTLYVTVVTGLQLRNFVEFTAVISLQDTPRVVLMVLLLLPVLYLAKEGIQVMARWSFIVCAIIVLNIALTILLSLNIIEVSHILPVMDHSFLDIASNSFTVGTITLGELVMMMAVMGHLNKGESPYKVYLWGVLVGICLFALIILRNILILGPDMEEAAKFSTYMAVRVIDIGKFFERIESSISFIYVLLGITKMSLFMLASATGLSKIFKDMDYRKLLLPISVIVVGIGTVVFKNVFEMFELAWVYRYYALPFQLLIPIIIWIKAEIKKSYSMKNN
jgi:spore germination protein KB